MKFEREKDIQVFQGKTWQERFVLRELAEDRDHFILWLRAARFLLGLILVVFFLLMIRRWVELSWPVAFAISMILSSSISGLFQALLITPRIRRVLQSSERSSA